MSGILYLFPTPIADNDAAKSEPPYNKTLIQTCDAFIVEEIRTARRYLRKVGYDRDFDSVDFYELNEHTDWALLSSYIEPLLQNKNMGLLSEAGLPCVADPGWQVVALAHRKSINVVPLVGASSLMLALMASGFCGQNFSFCGYLPVKGNERTQSIIRLEQNAIRLNQTQIFIEAPYRNNQLLSTLISTLRQDTMLCVATDLMMPSEQIISQPVGKWKQTKTDLNKRNSVFLIAKQNI
ncbi:MAG: SAM-dependent methyltransferase [Bacteroidales bacterium]|jgi:16S rRNA (cytidine1402-2'-O)-methyltransferase|nr:SAM-dependent methyltransferase [Bacteroidales bacterium]